LDPTTRRLRLPTNQNVLLSDTVGFIRKLPHGLVEAFKATLEEVVEADLLLHVVDVSHPQAPAQIEAVNAVLKEIGASDKPTLMVFNKLDALPNPEAAEGLCRSFDHAVAVSARHGTGFDVLLGQVGAMMRPIRDFLDLAVPFEAQKAIARLHSLGQIMEQDYSGTMARFRVRLPPHVRHEFEPYVVASL
jgi:GTP-binding protein HflX